MHFQYFFLLVRFVSCSWLTKDAIETVIQIFEHDQHKYENNSHILTAKCIDETKAVVHYDFTSSNVSYNTFISTDEGLLSKFETNDHSTQTLYIPIDIHIGMINWGHVLTIQYRVSSSNAGAMHISICDTYIGTIDTLVEDTISTVQSFSRTATYPTPISSFATCGNHSRSVVIEHFYVMNNKNRQHQQVVLEHIIFCPTKPRHSYPIPSGDGFLSIADYVCRPASCEFPDNFNNTPNAIFFIYGDFYQHFVQNIIPKLRNSYIIISHEGDISSPDGQNDAPRIKLPQYITSDILQQEYDKKRLVAHHGVNLWWKAYAQNHTRPSYLHCLPIGIETRKFKTGKDPGVYIRKLRELYIDRPMLTWQERSHTTLLLVAFYPKSRIPDRAKALEIIGAYNTTMKHKYYNFTDLTHNEWLNAIYTHRFVMAPFGHGLDTHRITEILLMGGIPVMRRSTISSCYDDSDNTIGTSTRGSLPIVVINSWKDLSEEFLEQEWLRITSIPLEHWDWSRMLLGHWWDRIRNSTVQHV